VLLTISHSSDAPAEHPASDLGYVLHKHPDHVRSVPLTFGQARVFWPSASADEATVALLVDVDPVALVRKARGEQGSLAQYVNDRPYTTSSFTSVALSRVFGSAMAGSSAERPDLAARPLALRVHAPVVPCRGGEDVLRRLFEPLGYAVGATALALDPQHPDWGTSRYLDVTLTGEQRVADLLTHLYVLLPVLDDDKHYWVSPDEIDKLLAKGGAWLAAHPERDLIVRRYLRHRSHLTAEAIRRLVEEQDDDPDAVAAEHDAEEAVVEKTISLNQRRLDAVALAVKTCGARSVVDLGCGEGRLLGVLLRDGQLARVAGMDVSHRALTAAARRLRLDTMPERHRARIELFQGSLTYRDKRLAGFDAATLIEVVEHLDPPRLDALERVVFGAAACPTIIVTTPNREYNVRWETLPAGTLRHRDHRFEWTRAELAAWADAVAARHGYQVTYAPIGDDDPEVGPPTQMAVFSR
jgi:3' terminal RNA ribose 2'-O-methyltransferase Hen1